MTKQKKETKQQDPPKTKALSDDRPQLPPAITVDLVKYAHHLDQLDLTEAQKCELLQVLWNIACEFVSLGFNVHPVQQVNNNCGKGARNPNETTLTEQYELSSLGQFITENIAEYSEPETERSEEGVET